MLILASISGIQDYLFQVRETGGKQARALRFRSLYIQLISESIGIRLLSAANLKSENIIFSAAGNIAIDAAGVTDDDLDRLHNELRAIEQWLRDKTHGRLRINVAMHHDPHQSLVQKYYAAQRKLQTIKMRNWMPIASAANKWQPHELLAASPPDWDLEADRDARFGQDVVQPNNDYIVFNRHIPDSDPEQGRDIVGLQAKFTSKRTVDGNALHVRDLSRLARHIPRENTTANGRIMEFVDLAKKSCGTPMLGVLKADADSLGIAISRQLENAVDLEPLRAMSRRLEEFFASDLDQQIQQDPRWSKLYTVFSGGDDLLLVGPWNIVLDFAGHLQQQFSQAFKDYKLTISAGVAIVKPKFPIRLAAQHAEQLLEQAKSGTKSQCAALGDVWKWEHHQTIIQAGKQLAKWVQLHKWVQLQIIQRGWLHTLLELALLRRDQANSNAAAGRSRRNPPEMATAYLAYHIARKWPKRNNSPRNEIQRAGDAARQWIDAVLDNFDQQATTSHIETNQLPAIIRYAMLATRLTEAQEINNECA